MTSTFSPESLPAAAPTDLKRQEVTPSAAVDADSDLEILEEEDADAVVVAESAETTTKRTEEGEEEEFWESLPVIDSRPLKKRKKKARPAQ
jgi:hypothetical protein